MSSVRFRRSLTPLSRLENPLLFLQRPERTDICDGKRYSELIFVADANCKPGVLDAKPATICVV